MWVREPKHCSVNSHSPSRSALGDMREYAVYHPLSHEAPFSSTATGKFEDIMLETLSAAPLIPPEGEKSAPGGADHAR